jgi:hypothetical protein
MIAVSKVLPAKPGNLQPDFAGLDMQLALVMTGSGIATSLGTLVALRIAQPICLSVQQGVQRVLHAARATRSRWFGGS